MGTPSENDRWAAAAAESAAAALAVLGERSGLVWSNARMRALIGELALPESVTLEELKLAIESVGARLSVSDRPLGEGQGGESFVAITVLEPSEAEPIHMGVGVAPEEIDPITGVLSRRGLEHEIQRRFADARSAPFALVFLDLDGFKAINDELGHLVGDGFLRTVGERLRRAVRAADAIGRFGGDEFVVLVDGVTSREDLDPVWTRLKSIGAEIAAGAPGGGSVGISAGVALTVDGYGSPNDLIHAADRQMYLAKRAKRSD